MKKRIIPALLAVVLVLSLIPAAFAAGSSFKDIQGHWAQSSIERWSEYGIVNGKTPDLFCPDDYMTRAEAAAVFTRLLQLKDNADISAYTDVESGSWYEGYISNCVAGVIMSGTSDTTMDPNGFITREQFFVMFAQAVGIFSQATCDKTFTDYADTADWAKGYVNALVNLGYVNGVTPTELAPKMLITRAMVMKLLDNAISDYITEDGTYTVSGNGIVLITAPNVALQGDFSGRIVTCPDNMKLDLSKINGKPIIFNRGKNSTITKAPVGTTVTAGPTATGLVVNETIKLIPNQTIIVPGSTSSGGSGGGGGGGTTSTYTVNASLRMAGLGTLQLNDVYIVNNSTGAGDRDLDTIMNDLITDTTGDDGMRYNNGTAIQNAIQAALNDAYGKTKTATSGGETVTISIGDGTGALAQGQIHATTTCKITNFASAAAIATMNPVTRVTGADVTTALNNLAAGTATAADVPAIDALINEAFDIQTNGSGNWTDADIVNALAAAAGQYSGVEKEFIEDLTPMDVRAAASNYANDLTTAKTAITAGQPLDPVFLTVDVNLVAYLNGYVMGKYNTQVNNIVASDPGLNIPDYFTFAAAVAPDQYFAPAGIGATDLQLDTVANYYTKVQTAVADAVTLHQTLLANGYVFQAGLNTQANRLTTAGATTGAYTICNANYGANTAPNAVITADLAALLQDTAGGVLMDGDDITYVGGVYVLFNGSETMNNPAAAAAVINARTGRNVSATNPAITTIFAAGSRPAGTYTLDLSVTKA